MKRVNLAVGLAATVLLAGCATGGAVAGGDSMRQAMLRYQPQSPRGLYVIAMEKEDANRVGRLPEAGAEAICDRDRCLHLERLGPKIAKNRRSELRQPRSVFLSHIVRIRGADESDERKACELIYSAYDTQACGEAQNLTLRPGPHAEAGWSALEDELYAALAGEVRDRGVSHLVIMSTGWKELQASSLKHYGDWAAGLDHELGTSRVWEPLYVGITWPAGWGGDDPSEVVKNSSVVNKMNDADEIGVGWGSILLNRTTAKLKTEFPDLKVVLIGHSYGARLVSQAAFSWPAMKSECGVTAPELLIGLQAAYSSARFIPGKGDEGSPFAGFADCGPTPIFTSTSHDKAMGFALFQLFARAKYLGRPQSEAMLQASSEIFEEVEVSADGVPNTSLPPRGKVVLLRADGMICDHNDVHDARVGRLMATLVRTYAWPVGQTPGSPAPFDPSAEDERDLCPRP